MTRSELDEIKRNLGEVERMVSELRKYLDSETVAHTTSGHVRFANVNGRLAAGYGHLRTALYAFDQVGASGQYEGADCRCGRD